MAISFHKLLKLRATALFALYNSNMADFDVSVPLHQDPANDPIVAGSINDHANEPLVKKKNKKKKKPAKKTGTGFEEFYADAPLTPGEYLYEKDVLYNK